jgi:Cu/Ag efflux pump CusA
VTTIVGLTPMMLERSIQAAFLQPIVVSLAFGVFFAFFVTLLMVPSLYGIGLDIDSFFSKLKKWVRSKLPGGSHSDVETQTP